MARFLIVILLGTLAWVLLAGLAVMVFSQQVAWPRPEIVPREVLSFAYSFAVAGTITGVAALATARQRRWAVGFGAISIILLASSVPLIRWLVFRATAPHVMWGRRVWDLSGESIAFSSAMGVVFALVIAGLVLAAVALERHTKAWQFGLLVAVAAALLGMWVLPAVISALSDLVVLYFGVNHRYLNDGWLRGAGTGAGTGALAGAIVAGLMARWYGSAQRAIEPPSEK